MSMINAILDVAGPEMTFSSHSGGDGIPVLLVFAIALLVVAGLTALFVFAVKKSKKKKTEEAIEKKEY